MKVASPESLARLLHERLAETGDPGRVLTLAEFLDEVLPYAVVRDAVGLAGKGEYDVAVLRFLCETGISQVDPDLREAAEAQLDSPEPRISFGDRLRDGLVRLRPGRVGTEPAAPVDVPPPPNHDPSPADVDVPPADDDLPPVDDDLPPVDDDVPPADDDPSPANDDSPSGGDVSPPADHAPPAIDEAPAEADAAEPVSCPRCSDPVPARPGVRFCPHCGLDLREERCHACGERLEARWRFCPRCGRSRRA